MYQFFPQWHCAFYILFKRLLLILKVIKIFSYVFFSYSFIVYPYELVLQSL